MTAGAHLRP